MKSDAKSTFISLTKKLEGFINFMYLDVKGYVTTGVGNLIENIATGEPGGAVSPFDLNWLKQDGTPATKDEINAEWHKVKSLQNLKSAGGGKFANYTTLRLSNSGVDDLLTKVMDQFDNVLATRFSNYKNWSAEAQAATMLIAWAYGPGFNLGALNKALNNDNFIEAAGQFPKSALTADRNDAIKSLYLTAGGVPTPLKDKINQEKPKDKTTIDNILNKVENFLKQLG